MLSETPHSHLRKCIRLAAIRVFWSYQAAMALENRRWALGDRAPARGFIDCCAPRGSCDFVLESLGLGGETLACSASIVGKEHSVPDSQAPLAARAVRESALTLSGYHRHC